MFIKVYTKSQLVMLRNLSPFFKKKYRFPKEIFDTVERILEEKQLGRTGFIAIIPHPIQDDMSEMRDIINLYPHVLKIEGDIVDVPIEEQHTWLTEDKEWYMDCLGIKDEKSHVYIIYSMTLETLYGKG